MIKAKYVATITLGDNKEYLIQDVTNIHWEGNELQKYYDAEGFYVTTQDGVDHYVERDELSAHDEKLLDRWVRRVPISQNTLVRSESAISQQPIAFS